MAMAMALAVGAHHGVLKQEWRNVTTCGLKQHQKGRGDIKWAPRNSERAQRAFRLETRKSVGTKSVRQKPLVKTVVRTLMESILESIYKRHWQNALKFFGMLRDQPWYEPNINTYRKLIVLLGRCGQPDQAHSLFQMMKEEGCQPDAEVYTALISAYSRSGILDKAFATLEEMKSISDCQPDAFTYGTLVKYCFEFSMFKHVDILLNEMESNGIMHSTVTKNVLIDGYGKADMFEEMGNVLSQMLTDDTCKPDEWTMNAILKAFGYRGDIEIMETQYTIFQNMGIQPDIRTFEILIGSYAKEHLYDKMAAVLEYMKESSLLWTTKTYNTVIDAFGGAGEIKQMEFVFNQMRLEGVKPDSTTFITLINGYAKAGIFKQIINIVQYAENSDIILDTSFFNSVIGACQRYQNFPEMERVFKEMKDRGCLRDQVTFTCIMEGYLKEGMPEKVKELEQEMQSIKLASV